MMVSRDDVIAPPDWAQNECRRTEVKERRGIAAARLVRVHFLHLPEVPAAELVDGVLVVRAFHVLDLLEVKNRRVDGEGQARDVKDVREGDGVVVAKDVRCEGGDDGDCARKACEVDEVALRRGERVLAGTEEACSLW